MIDTIVLSGKVINDTIALVLAAISHNNTLVNFLKHLQSPFVVINSEPGRG